MTGTRVFMPAEMAHVASGPSLAHDAVRIANRPSGNRQQVHRQLAEPKGIIPIGTIGYGIDILMRGAENRLIPWKGRG